MGIYVSCFSRAKYLQQVIRRIHHRKKHTIVDNTLLDEACFIVIDIRFGKLEITRVLVDKLMLAYGLDFHDNDYNQREYEYEDLALVLASG